MRRGVPSRPPVKGSNERTSRRNGNDVRIHRRRSCSNRAADQMGRLDGRTPGTPRAIGRPFPDGGAVSRHIARLRHTQGCLTDCVAYFFNVHMSRVPLFIYPRVGWNKRLKAFFARRGYKARWQQARTVPSRGVHIVCGDSLRWKTASHCVVYRNGQLVYDPNGPGQWKDARITHRLVVRRAQQERGE